MRRAATGGTNSDDVGWGLSLEPLMASSWLVEPFAAGLVDPGQRWRHRCSNPALSGRSSRQRGRRPVLRSSSAVVVDVPIEPDHQQLGGW